MWNTCRIVRCVYGVFTVCLLVPSHNYWLLPPVSYSDSYSHIPLALFTTTALSSAVRSCVAGSQILCRFSHLIKLFCHQATHIWWDGWWSCSGANCSQISTYCTWWRSGGFIVHCTTNKVNSCGISVFMYPRLSNSHFALASGLATHQLLRLQCNEDDLPSAVYSIMPRNLNNFKRRFSF